MERRRKKREERQKGFFQLQRLKVDQTKEIKINIK